mgnify:CR=1 FL=1
MSTNGVTLSMVNQNRCITNKSKKNSAMGNAALGAVIGGATGSCIASCLMSEKFGDIVTKHAQNRQNYRLALENNYTMIWDKHMNPILEPYKHNKLLASLGENPAKIGKIGLGITFGLIGIGALVGLIASAKKD